MVIRVLLADDQPAIRQGLRLRLDVEPDIDVVGEATNGNDAVTLAAALRPDVVVIDVNMPQLDGIEATQEIRTSATPIPVVILTLHDDVATRHRAQLAGAAAFVAKHQADSLLLDAIRQAASRAEPGGDLGGPDP